MDSLQNNSLFQTKLKVKYAPVCMDYLFIAKF